MSPKSRLLALLVATSFVVLPGAMARSAPVPRVAERCAGQEAYATHARPLPMARKGAALLPRTVGAFTREDIGPQVPVPSDEDLNVTYAAGKIRVFIGVSLPGSLKDRQEAVRVTWQEALADRAIDRTGEQLCLGKDMSFYKLRKFYAWTRGDFFFYADASDKATLDAFMAKFPY